MSRKSGLLSISSFQRKIEISAIMVTQAARLRSTSAQAIFSVSSFVPLVERIIFLSFALAVIAGLPCVQGLKSRDECIINLGCLAEAVLNLTVCERLFLLYGPNQVRNIRMARCHGGRFYRRQRAARGAWDRPLRGFSKTTERQASRHCGTRPALSGRDVCRVGAGNSAVPWRYAFGRTRACTYAHHCL